MPELARVVTKEGDCFFHEAVSPGWVCFRNQGVGALWRDRRDEKLYLLSQVSAGPRTEDGEMTCLYAFISLGGNRFREPCPFDELPLDLFQRVTEQTVVLFS